MKLAYGDMWSAWDSVDLFLITTNSMIVERGLRDKTEELVMGSGIALKAWNRFPDLPRNLAKAIKSGEYGDDPKRYGLIISKHWPKTRIGAFQTKYDWMNPSPLELIEFSTNMLKKWCEEHPGATVALNFPGVGCGKLRIKDVLPTINRLPDTVTVWTRHPIQ